MDCHFVVDIEEQTREEGINKPLSDVRQHVFLFDCGRRRKGKEEGRTAKCHCHLDHPRPPLNSRRVEGQSGTQSKRLQFMLAAKTAAVISTEFNGEFY